ncbi:MAG: hypothetical protein ACLGH3_00820 [Actinomycetota bacterium]
MSERLVTMHVPADVPYRTVVGAVAGSLGGEPAQRATEAAFDHALALVVSAHCIDASFESEPEGLRVELAVDGRKDREDRAVDAKAWKAIREASIHAEVKDGERGPVIRFLMPRTDRSEG